MVGDEYLMGWSFIFSTYIAVVGRSYNDIMMITSINRSLVLCTCIGNTGDLGLR